jgi:hypothetical protein
MNDFSPSILDSPLRRELGQLTGRPLRIVDNVEFASPVKFEELSEAPLQLIPRNSTTPSVLNLLRFKFQNTAPVTVTNFIGGQEGQHIMVIGDGNTTITHGTRIFNTSGANLLLIDNRVYSYVFAQGVWREQGGAPSVSLSALTAARASDLVLGVGSVWVDAVTLSLTAGTWLINAQATFRNTLGGLVIYAARLNVTTTRASTQITTPGAGDSNGNLSLTCIVTIGVTTNAVLQVYTNIGDPLNVLKSFTNISNSGNNATQITAVRVA